MIAEELAKRNELMAIQQQERKKTKKFIVDIVGAILIIIFISAIFDEWNEIWYEFGQSLYKLIY